LSDRTVRVHNPHSIESVKEFSPIRVLHLAFVASNFELGDRRVQDVIDAVRIADGSTLDRLDETY
jgi:hypothetical protein